MRAPFSYSFPYILMTTIDDTEHFDGEGWPAEYKAHRDPNMQDNEVQDSVEDAVEDATKDTKSKLTVVCEGAD